MSRFATILTKDVPLQGLLVMKNLFGVACLGLAGLTLVLPAAISAQEAELQVPRSDHNFFGQVPERSSQPDQESGYPRYETARELVFRNAALQAAQRRERMAINARFGYSPSRPPASTMPSMSSPIVPPTTFRMYTPYAGMAFPRPYARF